MREATDGRLGSIAGRMTLAGIAVAAFVAVVAVTSAAHVGGSTLVSAPGAVIDVGPTCSLADAIRAANTDSIVGNCPAGSGPDTIVLGPAETYTLTAPAGDDGDGTPIGLPAIMSEIEIQGNGSTIERSAPDSTPFRILFVNIDGKLTLDEVTLRGGRIDCASGAALQVAGGEATITGSTLTGNRTVGEPCGGGGALAVLNGTLNVSSSTISGNHASGNGGAILSDESYLRVVDSAISNNVAGGRLRHGGAIFSTSFDTGELVVDRSLVTGNRSERSGGIHAPGLRTVISNSTISGNRATSQYDLAAQDGLRSAGGIFADNENPSVFRIVNSTIVGNVAEDRYASIPGSTGGIAVSAVEVSIVNSIVAGNRAGDNTTPSISDCRVSAQTYSSSHNVLGTGGGCEPAASDVTIDPATLFTAHLGPLDGGTHAPLPGSAALDLGDDAVCAAAPVSGVDQRGTARGGCDAGAHEGSVARPAGSADLGVTLAVSPVRAQVGGSQGLTVRLRNFGPAAATGVQVLIPLPPTLEFASSVPADVFDPGTMIWSAGSLVAGGEAELQLNAAVTGAANVAHAEITASSAPDPNATNDEAAHELQQTTIDVGNGCSIFDAMVAANADLPAGGCSRGTGRDTIDLEPGTTYTLTEEWRPGGQRTSSGLPGIYDAVLRGYGATIERAVGAPQFRIMGVGDSTIDGVTFRNGDIGGVRTQSGEGGGLYVQGNVTITNSRFLGNRAQTGGGLFGWGNLTIRDSEFRGNLADSPVPDVSGHDGGGLAVLGDTRIERARIVDNSTIHPSGRGGGLWSGGNTTVVQSEISNNHAGGGGGVAHAATVGPDAHLTIANSTISGNDASGYIFGETGGGGIWAQWPITLINTTVTNNRGTGDSKTGGLLVNNVWGTAAVTLRNSIIAGNSFTGSNPWPGADCWNYPSNPVAFSGGSNLVGLSTGCPQTGNETIPASDVFSVALGPLADNGGTTKTHALLEGSPAINAGDDAACASEPVSEVDQRGTARPQGDACDIGAVEQEPPPLALTRLDPAHATSAGGTFFLAVHGTGFQPGSVVRWNGSPRVTSPQTPTMLVATIPASDTAGAGDIATALVTVRNPDGAVSAPLPFTSVSAKVGRVESKTALPGETVTASTAPTAAGQAGVSATLSNNTDGTGPATVTAATYSGNPTTGTVFLGGGFVDLRVVGADATDSATARFYYPTTVTGSLEDELELMYWNGSDFVDVRGSGGAVPDKNVMNNLDGTVSGGRISLTFDDTSSPKITELGGTVFTATIKRSRGGIIVNHTSEATNGSDGYCTLREAIVAANTDTRSGPGTGECRAGSGADTIYLQATETYAMLDDWADSGTGLPAITTTIAIEGGGSTILRDSGAPVAFRLLEVAASGNLTLRDAVLRGGAQLWHGGAIINRGTLSLVRSTVRDSRVTGGSAEGGGGIFNVNGALTLIRSEVTDNHVEGDPLAMGGGVSSIGAASVVTVTDSLIARNTLRARSAGQGAGMIASGVVRLTDTVVENNVIDATGATSRVSGAGLRLGDSDAIELLRTTIRGNRITGEAGRNQFGGGLSVAEGTVTLRDSTIGEAGKPNSAPTTGGGIFVEGADTELLIYGGAIEHNTASMGGGIGIGWSGFVGGSVRIEGGALRANAAGVGGGAIANHGGSVAMTGTALAANTVNLNFSIGGAIFNAAGSTAALDGVTANANEAGAGTGGAIGNEGTLTIVDSTFTANRARFGGAVANGSIGAPAGVMTIAGSTFLANTAFVTGGAFGQVGGTSTISGSTFRTNTSSFGEAGAIGINGGSATLASSTVGGPAEVDRNSAARFGGGISVNGGTLTVNGGTVTGNTALGSGSEGGGGIALTHSNAKAILDGATFRGNRAASGVGGGALNKSGTLEFLSGAFAENSANEGGAIYSVDGSLQLGAGRIEDNSAEFLGGGVANHGNGARVEDTVVTGNEAGVHGGGILNTGSGLVIAGATIADNSAVVEGGGLRSSGGAALTDGTLVQGNSAGNGGGIFSNGTLVTDGAILRENTAGAGGGVLNWGSAVIQRTQVVSNTANGYGGGVANELGGTARVVESTVAENRALATTGAGGGLSNVNGALTVERSLVRENTSGGTGGGLRNGFGSTTQVLSSTLTGNTAGGSGGAVVAQSGATTLVSGSTVVMNTATAGGGISTAGTTTVAGSILASNTAEPLNADCQGAVILSSTIVGLGGGCPQLRPVAPSAVFTSLLHTLADNGGPTPTFAPRFPGAAIDTGHGESSDTAGCPTRDQRGIGRPQDGDSDGEADCDLGAVELQNPPADLSLTLTSNVAQPPAGTQVTVTARIRNDGPGSAPVVRAHFRIPTWLTPVSPPSSFDPVTGVWEVGTVANGATATLALSLNVSNAAPGDITGEITRSGSPDPDSTPDNAVRTEDDYARLRIGPAGIRVNSTSEAIDGDGLCTLTEAVYAAQNDTTTAELPGECTAGDGADTIHLQTSETYRATDFWTNATAYPPITTNITIEGHDARIERGITPSFFRAFRVHAGGTLRLRNLALHFFEVRNSGCGGAIQVGFGTLALENVFLSQNRVRDDWSGGGAICSDGNVTASNSRIEDNTVDVSNDVYPALGGGISACDEGCVTRLTNTTVRNNVVTSKSLAAGGGIRAGGELTLAGGAVRENRAILTSLTSRAYGGGISAFGDSPSNPAEVRITGTTLSENHIAATGQFREAYGGGLAVGRGTATLVDAIVGGATEALGNRGPGGGGGIYVAHDAELAVVRGAVGGNTALAGSGGGGIMSTGGLIDLQQVELSGNNGGSGSGGAVRSNGLLKIRGGSISSNTAAHGGGISNDFGTLELTDGLIFGNTAHHQGGGIVIQRGSGSATIVNTQIATNAAGVHGGGIVANVPTQLTNSTVTGNRLVGGSCTVSICPAGGGVYMIGKTLTLTDSEISSNNALVSGALNSSGGAISSDDEVRLTRSTIAQNAARFGGGVHLRDGYLSAQDTTFELNNALYGGAVNILSSSATLERSTIDGNRATEWGGGIVMNETSLGLYNATVSRNVSENVAGAIYHGSDSILTVFSSTITGNDALKTGGIFSFKPDGGLIISSIVAGNRSQATGDPDCDADSGSPPPSGGSNVFAVDGGCSPRSDLGDWHVASDEVATKVVFPLADNGGSTATHALRPSSPALDAVMPAACVVEDQRRSARPKDGDGDGEARCDSGAFEQQTPLLLPLRATSLLPSILSPGADLPNRVVDVVGTGFGRNPRVLVNGQPRETWLINSSRIQFRASAQDVAVAGDLATLVVTVSRPDGAVSNPLALTVKRENVDSIQSAGVAPGSSATVSAHPTTIGLGASISATLTNNGGGPAAITAATYQVNPTGGTIFSAGGFVDIQVTGADADDRATVTFYYPLTVQGTAEDQLQLSYFPGSLPWRQVRGQGGARPVKNKADNPDGTGMGGKFTVTFGNTSTPKITELSGTVLGTDLDGSAPTTAAEISPVATASGWHAGDVTVTLNATDDVGVASTEWSLNGGPFQAYGGAFTLSGEGLITVRYRSTDESENVETERSVEVRIDKTAPATTVAALPATTRATQIPLSWTGSDAGSGVASYDVYVSTNGGAFQRFLTATTETSATFTGAAGRTYGFAAVATDRVGHTEAAPSQAEATTRILPAVRPKPKPKPKKVTLCHKGKTIKVPKSQVAKHRKHRDKLAACKKKKPKRKARR